MSNGAPPGDNPQPYEPPTIRAMAGMIAKGQQALDSAWIARIWAEFKWELKTKDVTYQDIDKLLEQAMEKTRLHVKDKDTRAQVLAQFEIMRNRLSEFTAEPPEDDQAVCTKCGLKKFICPCPKEP